MKPRFIDGNMFLDYTGIDLTAALRDDDNPSAKVESFLGRVELRVMSWVDKNTFRVRDWNSLTNYQIRMFRYALLEQAAYMFRNGDIAQDSGYDQERGVVADKRALLEITVCQPCIDFLIQAGLFNSTIKNRRRFMNENVMVGDGIPYDSTGSMINPGGGGGTPTDCYTKAQIDAMLRNYEKLENKATSLSDANDTKYPTTLAVATALGNIDLSGKEDVSNKVQELSSASTTDQYPSAKCVWDLSVNLREVAEGKCKAYVLSYDETAPDTDAKAHNLHKTDGTAFEDLADFTSYVSGLTLNNSAFNSQNDYITLKTSPGGYYYICNDGLVLKQDDLLDIVKIGDIFLVIEIDVPDRWFGLGNWGAFRGYKLETSKVDLTGYVDTTSGTTQNPQNITGWKYFSNGFAVGQNDIWITGHTSGARTYLSIAPGQSDGISIDENCIAPAGQGSSDLGSSSSAWQNLYLSGNVSFVSSNTAYNVASLDSSNRLNINYNGTTKIKVGNTETYFLNHVEPDSNNSYDLGRWNSQTQSGLLWRDLYLSRNLSDGTNSITVDKIASKDLIADIYSNTATYAQGDLVIHGNTLYKCNTTISTAEDWDATHWDATKVVDEAGGTVVAAASYNTTDTPLSAITIGSTTYRMAPVGSNPNQSARYVCIGESSSVSASDAVAIGCYASGGASGVACLGNNSTSISSFGVAIGYSAGVYGSGTRSIAIGTYSINNLPDSVSFDPSNATRQKVIHCYSPEKIFFRNDVSSTSYSTFESYKSGHYLSEYIQNNELVFNSNKYYVSYTDANNYKTFSKVVSSGTATDISSAYNGIRLIVKLSDNTSVSLDLLPYDTANTTAITAKVILSFADYITAYIDADGCVNIGINSSSLITITSAYYNLR